MLTALSSRPRVILILLASVIAVIVVVVVVLQASARSVKAPPHSTTVWFFDEADNHLSRVPDTSVPPLPGAKNELTKVRVVFRGAGTSISDIHYLYRFTPEAKADLLALPKRAPDIDLPFTITTERHGAEVRTLNPPSPWRSASSPEGQAILNSP